MDKLKALVEKIEIIRNDTNAYGFDDDNKTIAEAFELVSDMLGKNNSSQGEKGEKGDKGEPFRYEDFTAEQLNALKGDMLDFIRKNRNIIKEILDTQMSNLTFYLNGDLFSEIFVVDVDNNKHPIEHRKMLRVELRRSYKIVGVAKKDVYLGYETTPSIKKGTFEIVRTRPTTNTVHFNLYDKQQFIESIDPDDEE